MNPNLEKVKNPKTREEKLPVHLEIFKRMLEWAKKKEEAAAA